MNLKYYLRGLGLGILVTAVILLIAGRTGTGKGMSDDDVIKRAKELGMVQNTTLVSQDQTEEDQNTELAEVADASSENITVDGTKDSKDENSVAGRNEQVKDNTSDQGQKTDVTNDASSNIEATDGQKTDSDENSTSVKEKSEEKSDVTVKEDDQTTTDPKKDDQTTDDSKKEDQKADDSKKDDQKSNEQKADDGKAGKEENNAAGTKTGVVNPTSGDEVVTVEVKSGDSSVRVAQRLVEAGLVDDASSYDNYLCENGFDRKLRVGTYQIPAGASDRQIALYITGQN